MTITRRDYDLLHGLQSSGQSFIAASEADDALRLADDGLVEIWQINTGFSAWRSSDKGKRRIERAKANLEAIV